jgi:hypothetical protein
MQQENDERSVEPDNAFEDDFDDSEELMADIPLDDDFEPDAIPDSESVEVSLKRVIFSGEECVEVYAHGEKDTGDGLGKRRQSVLLARILQQELTMFPLVSASYRSTYLTSKYEELTSITIVADEYEPWWLPNTIAEFDGLLESLPVGFGRHAKYGLGLKWEYRLIPAAILEIDGVTQLIIEPGDGAIIQLPMFRLGVERFSAIKRSIDSIANRSRARSLRERRLFAFNELLHVADPAQFERQFARVKPGEIYELVKLGGEKRNASDRLAAATVIREDAVKFVAEQPAQLLELKSVIEQVTLAELVNKIEVMLGKNLSESQWQTFFKSNPFVLSLAFPYPVVLIQDQAHVGGTMLRGSGESIVDFLFAQRFTGSLALIEIKRPSTKLIENKTFRGDLYAPHRELTSAMAQVLDQRFQLLNNFATKAHDLALKDTHVSAVHCIVIAGTTPITIEEKRSLDLFRHASKDVVVVAFDELLDKLREILRLMSGSTAACSTP